MRLKSSLLVSAGVAFIVSVAACGQNGFSPSGPNPANGDINKGADVGPQPTPAPQNADLAICSALSLQDIIWPTALDNVNKRALALALNISGSFEGSQGWKNITNSFDGQGLSLGLLNQCLGQGSLQPLLAKMRDQHLSQMTADMTSAHMSSLESMLTKWQGIVKTTSEDDPGEGDEDMMADGRLSLLDELPDGEVVQESADGDSVTWAKQNLYTDGGTTFVGSWKSDLQRLAADPMYVSVQIGAAMTLHTKAVAYMKTLGLKELRSYLMLFDINVQDGGLYTSDITSYKAAFPAGSSADETTRLKKILDIRLAHVVSKYRADVQARKLSIINGSGVVHGTNRNYQKQYCFDGNLTLL